MQAKVMRSVGLALAVIALIGVSFAGTTLMLQKKSAPLSRRLVTEAFSKGGTGTWLLGKGWSAPESWGTWSEGEVAEINWPLREEPRSELLMWIDGRIYPYFADVPQRVRVSVNGTHVATLERNFEGGLYGASFKVPLRVALARKPMRLVFEVSNPTSPQSINNGTDPRRLGVGLKSIEIEYSLL